LSTCGFPACDSISRHVLQHLKDIPDLGKLPDSDGQFYLFSIHDVNKDGYLDGHELRDAFVDFHDEESGTLTLDEIIKMVDHILDEDDMDNE
jgi:hypothetical protein